MQSGCHTSTLGGNSFRADLCRASRDAPKHWSNSLTERERLCGRNKPKDRRTSPSAAAPPRRPMSRPGGAAPGASVRRRDRSSARSRRKARLGFGSRTRMASSRWSACSGRRRQPNISWRRSSAHTSPTCTLAHDARCPELRAGRAQEGDGGDLGGWQGAGEQRRGYQHGHLQVATADPRCRLPLSCHVACVGLKCRWVQGSMIRR